jgi:hypothetical protein
MLFRSLRPKLSAPKAGLKGPAWCIVFSRFTVLARNSRFLIRHLAARLVLMSRNARTPPKLDFLAATRLGTRMSRAGGFRPGGLLYRGQEGPVALLLRLSAARGRLLRQDLSRRAGGSLPRWPCGGARFSRNPVIRWRPRFCTAYGHAARYLEKLDALAAHDGAASPIDPHETYRAAVAKKHGRKIGFWSFVKGRK